MIWFTWIVLALAAFNAYAGAASERKGEPLDDEPITTKKTMIETEIDCVDRENGKYSIGCSAWFVMCMHANCELSEKILRITVHIAYKYDCPARLKWDPLLGQCDYESGIKQCTKNGKIIYKGKIIKTPSDFSCATRTDKLYAHPEIPCSKYYYSCSQGNAARQLCPLTQLFDEKLQRCDYNVPACKHQNIWGVLIAPTKVPYDSLSEPLEPAPPTTSNRHYHSFGVRR